MNSLGDGTENIKIKSFFFLQWTQHNDAFLFKFSFIGIIFISGAISICRHLNSAKQKIQKQIWNLLPFDYSFAYLFKCELLIYIFQVFACNVTTFFINGQRFSLIVTKFWRPSHQFSRVSNFITFLQWNSKVMIWIFFCSTTIFHFSTKFFTIQIRFNASKWWIPYECNLCGWFY